MRRDIHTIIIAGHLSQVSPRRSLSLRPEDYFARHRAPKQRGKIVPQLVQARVSPHSAGTQKLAAPNGTQYLTYGGAARNVSFCLRATHLSYQRSCRARPHALRVFPSPIIALLTKLTKFAGTTRAWREATWVGGCLQNPSLSWQLHLLSMSLGTDATANLVGFACRYQSLVV